MIKRKRIIDFFADSENIELSKESVESIEQDWVTNFCPISKKEKADIHFDQYKWHVFSFEKYPSLSGQDALSCYSEQKAPSYIVLPEFQMYDGEVAFITKTLPERGRMDVTTDFYVFPKNIAWTMAFTHEEGWLGPYFAKNSNYKKLNRKNSQAITAKNRGW